MTLVMSQNVLEIPSHPKAISDLEVFVQKMASKYNICSDKYPDILISLTEAVNNAIIHGNKGNKDKKVAVTLVKNKTGLCFKVSDQGVGFNHNTIPNPTQDDLLECCGGRGVHIIKELCDKVSFLNNGTTIEMFFYHEPA